LIVQSFGSRLVLFGSQLLLAWLLTPADFGKSALASTISTVAWSFIGFGADEVLQQRSHAIHMWEKSIFVIALGQGALAALLICVAAPIAAHMFGVPELLGMLLLAAASLMIASFSVVPAAKVSASLDFAWMAAYNSFEVVFIQGLIVLFAWAGFGPYAFFMPAPIGAAVRAGLLWRRARPRLTGRIRLLQLKPLFGRGTKVLGLRIAQAVLSDGDYFLLGLYAATNIVGAYTFAFRLAAVPARVIATNLQSVLFPTLTRLRGDPARQNQAALKAAEVLAHVVTPLCGLQAVIAGPVLGLLFGNKWSSSIRLIQLLSVGLPAEATYAVVRARLGSSGHFGRALLFACIQCVGFVTAVLIGASLAKDVGVAIGVSAFHLLVIPVLFARALDTGDRALHMTWRIFLCPLLFALASAALAIYLAKLLPGIWPATAMRLEKFAEIAVLGAAMTISYIALLRLFNAEVFRTIMELLHGLTKRLRA
jgi:PST family polysaccharide transporter